MVSQKEVPKKSNEKSVESLLKKRIKDKRVERYRSEWGCSEHPNKFDSGYLLMERYDMSNDQHNGSSKYIKQIQNIASKISVWGKSFHNF